jgi:hypothetical protein
MTPLQAAKTYCANYQPDGSCLGIAFRDDLSTYHFRAEELPCLLRTCDACPYFEETILPQVPASLAEEYRESLPAAAKTSVRPQRGIKLCPDCRKNGLAPRQRYCARCAAIRKRESKRQYMRRKRGLDVEQRTVQVPQLQGPKSAQKDQPLSLPQTSVLGSSFSTCKSGDTGS